LRIDSLNSAGGNTTSTSGDVLNKLKPGDTVRAQVLENNGNELTLKLSDGSKVSASAMSPVDASNGDYVNFEYKGSIDGKPAFEVVTQNIQPQVDTELENLKNTLAGLNLPVTDQNIELAQALKQQNIPITADSMAKVTELVANNSQLKPDAAAFLAAANMGNDKNSIEKLQSLLAGRLKVSNDIADLIKLTGAFGENQMTAVDSEIINDILGKLSSKITSGSMAGKLQNEGAAMPNNSHTAETASNSGKTSVGNSNEKIPSNTLTAAASSENKVNNSSDTAVKNHNANESAGLKTSSAAANNNSAAAGPADKAAGSNVVNDTKVVSPETIISDSKATGGDGKNTAVMNNSTAAESKNEKPMGIAGQISNLLKGGKSFGSEDLPMLKSLSVQLQSMADSGKHSQEEIYAIKLISKEVDMEMFKIHGKEAALNPEKSGNIKAFEDAVNNLKNLFVKIDHSSEEINPVKLYRNMDNAIHTLKSSIQQLPETMQQTAMNIVNNVESNVKFINQLNNYSSYVQIPLSIFNKNTTGELYMLKKGSKSRKLDASRITVLISLDSNNIGRIDTLLSVDKKNISTNFRLENSDAFDILKENHKQLYTSLLGKGYRLIDFSYRLIDEPINIVNFEAEAKKEFIKNPGNIDILI
jgi:hypothetical protein